MCLTALRYRAQPARYGPQPTASLVSPSSRDEQRQIVELLRAAVVDDRTDDRVEHPACAGGRLPIDDRGQPLVAELVAVRVDRVVAPSLNTTRVSPAPSVVSAVVQSHTSNRPITDPVGPRRSMSPPARRRIGGR